MKRDIVLAGVGGQGLLSLAAVITKAAANAGLCVKQTEIHGMSQRGGMVESHVRLSDREIHSSLIREGTADLIIALEPMEGLRHLPFLAPEGAFVASTVPVLNIPDYPDVELILAEIRKLVKPRLIDAVALGKKAGASRAANMALLGAASPFIGIPEEGLIAGIESVFAGRLSAEMIAANIAVFRLGLAAAGS